MFLLYSIKSGSSIHLLFRSGWLVSSLITQGHDLDLCSESGLMSHYWPVSDTAPPPFYSKKHYLQFKMRGIRWQAFTFNSLETSDSQTIHLDWYINPSQRITRKTANSKTWFTDFTVVVNHCNKWLNVLLFVMLHTGICQAAAENPRATP